MADSSPTTRSAPRLDIRELSCGRLFDEVPCYISIQGPDYRVLEANRKLIEEFGSPLGRYCWEVYKGRAERCPECPVARTFADGEEHTSEEVIFDARGLPHNVVVNTKPLRRRDDGEIVAVMELFTDITVQKELERRLHDSLTRFHNLFDTVPCFISVQDRELTVVEANRRFKETFGERLGGRCYEIYKRRKEPCPECPVARTFEDGRTHHSEEVVIARDGRELHVLTHTAAVRDRTGRITSVMEVSTDITEVKELQNKLAFIGQLVAGTAHSIKNVLEGLRGGVYVVNAGLRDNSQETIRTGWEMVQRNVERLSAMIMDMLYCARDREPRRLEVSLDRAAREVAELFARRARDAGVRLEVAIEPGAETLYGEPRDIHALLANLVTNAIDACAADADDSKDYRVTLRARREGGDVIIEVEDNGVGMDEETKAKLFTMFFSTKGPEGTGLGLLVSHKVAAEHGGSITVDSAPGRGSKFTVRLPASGPPVAS